MKKTFLLCSLLSLSHLQAANNHTEANGPTINANGGLYAVAAAGTGMLAYLCYTWYTERCDQQKQAKALTKIIFTEFKPFEKMLHYSEHDLLNKMNNDEQLKQQILQAIEQRDINFPHLDLHHHVRYYKNQLKQYETLADDQASAEIHQLHQMFNNILAVLSVHCKDQYAKEEHMYLDLRETTNNIELNAAEVEKLQAKITLLQQQEQLTEAQKKQILEQGSHIQELLKNQINLDKHVNQLAKELVHQQTQNKEQLNRIAEQLQHMPHDAKENLKAAFNEWDLETQQMQTTQDPQSQ